MSSSYTDGYDFTSSDDGYANLSNFIKFKKNNYDYKVRVYAENDTSIYKEITFTVGTTNNNTSNGELDNFYLSADDTTPSTSQYVDLNIKARDSDDYTITDYTDTVNFKVYYRANESSSWTQTTSSTYYTMGSDYTDGYDFSSSDDGYANLSNFIKFKKNNYDYKVRVYAENDTSIYKEITFNVGSNNNNTSNGELDNFYLTTSTTTPSTSEYVDLTINARDSDDYTITDYTDTVKFKVYYRANESSSWIQTTSSTYYTMNSDYTDGYDFSSSDDGIAELTNFIKFKKNDYDYKVRIYAENDTSIYKEITFNIGSDNNTSNGELDNFYLTTDDTTPSILQRVDLTIKARDSDNYTITDYTDAVNFKVYYRANNSSSWTQTTSSSYYTISSSYTDGYDFTSSNDGIAGLNNFIEFNKKNYDYKVRVYAENDTSIYKEITFTVGTTNNNNTSNGDLDNFYVTSSDTTPSTSEYVDLNIKARDSDDYTITDYTDTVNFKVYYKPSSSSSWTQTTSSTYYTMGSSYTNGYDFTSSDDGYANLSNFIKFKKNNYDYKVRVYAENDTSIYKEITFNVGTTSSYSSVNGFTSSELNTVKNIYNARPGMISTLEDTYPALNNNNQRRTTSDNLYNEMELIINDDNDRIYKYFNDFYNAWSNWYRFTIGNK